MTQTGLGHDPHLQTAPVSDEGPASSGPAPATFSEPASPTERGEHEQARWSGWLTARERDNDANRRRFYLIAAVVVVALAAWLFWSFYF